MKKPVRISVFTPTYNRAKLLDRVFSSLMAQDFSDFEWIVIDDGSADNTVNLVEQYASNSPFPVKLVSRENRGKAASINEALEYAAGELFLVFDSDDWCVSSAFRTLINAWDELSDDEKIHCSGVSCVKKYQSGKLVGDDYSRMQPSGETYIDRHNRGVDGDKWEMIRTDVHKLHRYDLQAGEKYMAPGYAWLGIGKYYKTLFLNVPLSIIEYQPDGISRNNIAHRAGSPRSAAIYYLRAYSCSQGLASRLRAAANHARFSMHAGSFPSIRSASVFAMFPLSVLAFVIDLIRIDSKNRYG